MYNEYTKKSNIAKYYEKETPSLKVGYIKEETPSLIFENNIEIGYLQRGNP